MMSDVDWDSAPGWANVLLEVANNSSVMAWAEAWQDGAKALKIGGSGIVYPLCRDRWRVISERHAKPTEWDGEGLPPVGVRVEAAIPHTSGPDNERSFIWIEGSVIAYYEIRGKTYAWFAEDDGFYPPNVLEFRPIRTPAQIEAEKRADEIERMRQVVDRVPAAFDKLAALYDAGLRFKDDE